MDAELDRRLAGIESKLDIQAGKIEMLAVQIPRFVTWGRLGGAVATISGIVIAVVNLVL